MITGREEWNRRMGFWSTERIWREYKENADATWHGMPAQSINSPSIHAEGEALQLYYCCPLSKGKWGKYEYSGGFLLLDVTLHGWRNQGIWELY